MGGWGLVSFIPYVGALFGGILKTYWVDAILARYYELIAYHNGLYSRAVYRGNF